MELEGYSRPACNKLVHSATTRSTVVGVTNGGTENAGMENAGLKNAGSNFTGEKRRTAVYGTRNV